jgi:recombination protein RecA
MLGGFTSGISTLALKVMANAQQSGQLAAYVDLGATFDPDYAARCGVHLAQLLLVRPATVAEALEITHSLIAGRGAGLVVFDDVSQLLAAESQAHIFAKALRQLPASLAKTQNTLIFLTLLHGKSAMSADNYPGGFALPHYTTLRLQLKKERWLYHYRDVRGYQARVVVLKNKLGKAGQQASITIKFNGTVRGDAT